MRRIRWRLSDGSWRRRQILVSSAVQMVILHFQPRSRYTILPRHWTYRLSFGLIHRWRNLLDVARFAQERRGYGDTDFGFGIEYPTRPDKLGQVRFWRWQWRSNGKIKTRKYYFPEADYLGTLAAYLRAEELFDEAAKIENIMPLPNIAFVRAADPHDISNYAYKTFFPPISDAMRLILEQWSFDVARARANAREAFTIDDGSGVEYLSDGTIEMRLPHGRTQIISEELYLQILEAAYAETKAACRDLTAELSRLRQND